MAMKSEKFQIYPTVKIVLPVPESLLQRSFIVNETKDLTVKNLSIFDEIFPDKKKENQVKEIEFKEENNTFHRAMVPVLTVGQCFGILPVLGIRKPDASHLKFAWLSWLTFYTLLNIICAGFLFFMCLVRMIVEGVDLFKTVSLVFFCSSLLVLLLFLRLAKKWPALISSISRQERPRRLTRRPLHSRVSWCCFGILLPALVEHILASLSGFVASYDCTFSSHLVKTYFLNGFPQIFRFVDYALWKGIMLQLFNLVSTFNWNFMDLFIIAVSMGLADRFTQLNNRLEIAKEKSLPEEFWKSVREEYALLSRVVKEVDAAINEIVLLSFANNLYFICVQLFNSLNNAHLWKINDDCGETKAGPLRALVNVVYFGFSFGFLMVRFLAVSLGAARIHSSSRQPAAILYATPSSSYGAEAQRFLEQVVTDNVALTGMSFFNVTRGLVLTIAGTIVTYELVLVQFNTAPPPYTANITINESCGVPIKV